MAGQCAPELYGMDHAILSPRRSMASNSSSRSSSQPPATARNNSDRMAARDYIHEASFFMNAKRTFKSEFTISPEWISETQASQQNSQRPMKSSFVIHPEWVSENSPNENLRTKQMEAHMRMTRSERL